MQHTLKVFALACIIFFNRITTNAQDCSQDSTGLIPLVDLLTGYYGTYQGGLYPGGTNNMPLPHKQYGQKLAKKIKPTDTNAVVNYATGKVLMATFGASIASRTIRSFNDSLLVWTGINRCFASYNATRSSTGIEVMHGDTADWYWDFIIDKMHDDGYSPEQVQVAWFYSTYNRIDADVVGLIDTLIYNYIEALHEINTRFPNCKIIFMSGMHYGDYADSSSGYHDRRVEPACYYSNIAIKEVIARQISGDPSLKYTTPGKQCPYLAWGPNLWADGKNPRTYDSLTWMCDEYLPGDGFHLKDAGYAKEAGMLKNFLKASSIATSWFNDGVKWASCPVLRMEDPESNVLMDNEIAPSFYVWLYNDTENDELYFDFAGSVEGIVNYAIYNIAGQKITNGIKQTNDDDGSTTLTTASWLPGIYLAVFEMNGIKLSKKIIIF